jgi:hypothetical protein
MQNDMPTALEVKALPDFRLRLRYDDGIEGVVDVSDLIGRGVFAAWEEPGFFERAHVAPHGAIAWSEEIELCPDALYLRLTEQSPEDVLPGLKVSTSHA